MSPPEVWGPAVWTLFHTLGEKINEEAYPYVSNELFKLIVRICKFLPCPECSTDASNFLAKIKMSELKTKADFKNTFYLFHNYVNSKKRKRLFNYVNLNVYNKYRLIDVVNNFIANYHTKGNMRMLTESFQRQFVVKDFKNWFTKSMKAFIKRVNIPPAIRTIKVAETIAQSDIQEEVHVVQEEVHVVQEEVHVVQEEEVHVVQEEEVPVVQEEEVHVVQEEEVHVVQEEEVHVVQEEELHVVQEEEVHVVQEEEVHVVKEEVPVVQEEISIAGIK
jgi:hypothetical protein